MKKFERLRAKLREKVEKRELVAALPPFDQMDALSFLSADQRKRWATARLPASTAHSSQVAIV